MSEARVETAAKAIREATGGMTEADKVLAARGAGIPTLPSIPDAAWSRMAGWQAFVLILVMFLAVVGIFGFLLVTGRDLVIAANASETAKTLGNTMVGAALGMVGGAAAGAGATGVAKK